MIKNNYVQQFLATPASSCLTNQDLTNIDVQCVALNLQYLLLRPVFDSLMSVSGLRKYLAWNGSVVVNGAGLCFANNDTLQIRSAFNGNKYFYTSLQLFDFFDKIQADIVLLPRNIKEDIPISSTKYYCSQEEYKDGLGVYFAPRQHNLQDIQNFVNSYPGTMKYLAGNFDLDVHKSFISHPDLMLENTKFCTDAYQGIVYRENFSRSILTPDSEYDFSKLIDKCGCSTCQQG